MRIIKEGNLKHPIVFECPRCDCIFEADEDEYLLYRSSMKNTRAEILCPHCNTLIIEYPEEEK